MCDKVGNTMQQPMFEMKLFLDVSKKSSAFIGSKGWNVFCWILPWFGVAFSAWFSIVWGSLSTCRFCMGSRITPKPGVHNLVAIARRIAYIFMNYVRQWVKDIYIFVLLLFCFHTLRACFHTSLSIVLRSNPHIRQTVFIQLMQKFYGDSLSRCESNSRPSN